MVCIVTTILPGTHASLRVALGREWRIDRARPSPAFQGSFVRCRPLQAFTDPLTAPME